MRGLLIFLGLWCCCGAIAQDKRAERNLRKARNGKAIEQVKPRKWEKVRAVTCLQYTDSVFPNEALLRLKNVESIYLWGRTWKRERKYIPLPPIPLRIDTVALKRLPHLKYVSLRCFDLRKPPTGLSSITGLEGLEMNVCLLDSLPDDIGRMRNLRALDLRLNYLKDLPPEIAELDSLRSINLVNNHFRRVPVELAGCVSLERIYLSNDETGHGIDHGYEPEYQLVNWDWDFPLCSNHIDWRGQLPALRALLDLPRLEYIRLHARGCKEQKAAQAELASEKIRFSKPMLGCPDRWLGRLMAGSPTPPPYAPDAKDCTCAGMGY